MSAIKDFFKKKKMDAKFKVAGGGQKLGESSGQGGASAAAAAAQRRQPAERQHPSSSSQQAGAAALNRMAAEKKQQSGGLDSEEYLKNRQRALIKEQARKELEKEKAVDEEIQKLKEVYGDKEEVVHESSGHLAAQGVFFRCPLIGDDVYPKDVMKRKIREFLYSQLELERGLTAALIIHTCNTPRERVETCVETLCKYLDNIIQNPSEPKYRKIRKSNKAFQERVASLDGTEHFILDCGFQLQTLPGADGSTEEEFWVLPESADLEHITMLQDSLRSCEPLTAELDRGIVVIKPGSENSRNIGSLPPDFFSVTTAEVKAEMKSRADSLERESMLRTQAMRDKEASVGRRKYKYCVVRIRFPDGYILQGTFSVYEALSAVADFVTENLEMPLPFHLMDTVTGARLQEMSSSLQELGLVPASILNFRWEPEIEQDLQASGANSVPCLKASLIS
eukprot:TRINITY_DN3846_c0_g1_i1.p1 TRINITY_DN3846_c0_g1~~TRINITY_DN3846_c0_g1_i1.p1  ORF type:complete len:452 (-),score=134.37 TRINITY_DN3846_c0_g1_i1:465-1820(-)